MPRVGYHTTSEVWLSLEDFHNAGLTSEETREVIEGIRDPFESGFGNNLRVRPMYVNGNWIVATSARAPDSIAYLVRLIEMSLLTRLEEKNARPIQ